MCGLCLFGVVEHAIRVATHARGRIFKNLRRKARAFAEPIGEGAPKHFACLTLVLDDDARRETMRDAERADAIEDRRP